MDQLIKEALADKHMLSFTYNGHKRIVEPHIFGIKDNKKEVLCYQTGGTTSEGTDTLPEWRRFKLSRMSSLHVLPDTFDETRRTYTGEHSEWDSKIANVGK